MDNPGEILRLCRLCLVKDQVNIPIFEEQGDIRQIFLKISSCLPVKVSLEDKLPKRICDGCSNKLDLLYEFWNTSANAEKTLLSWLGQAGVKDADETISAVAQQIAKPAETQVKQEALDEGHASNQVHDSFGVQSFDEEAKDESEAPPPKRARRTAAVKAQINLTPESDEDDDMDSAEAMTKVEDESDESDGEDKDPSYGEIPGTSADDQAGPSGVGKDGVEAPSLKKPQLYLIKTENGLQVIFDTSPPVISNQEIVQSDETAKADLKVCPLCGKDVKYLQQHIKFQHYGAKRPERDFPGLCQVCGKVVKKMNHHIRIAHQKEFPCDLCCAILNSQALLDEHKEVHNSEHYKCDKCTMIFKSLTDLALHNHSHTGTYVCPKCNLVFKTRQSLKGHVNKEEDKFNYHCHICGKGYVQHHLLKCHIERHENIKKHECDICHKKFALKMYLKTHKKFNHKKELFGIEEVFQCEMCARKFTFECSLKRHLNLVHKIGEERSVTCPICNKVLTTTHSRNVHMRLHTGEKKFSCKICGEGFARTQYVTRHMARIHGVNKVRN